MVQSGNSWCPYGAEANPSVVCSGLKQIDSLANLLQLWPGGVPSWADDVVAALDVGSMACSDLCSVTPTDPGPFEPLWLLHMPTPNAISQDLSIWLVRQLFLVTWRAFCQCANPPALGYGQVASITFPCSTTTDTQYFGMPDATLAWNAYVVWEMDQCGTWLSGQCPSMNWQNIAYGAAGTCYPGGGAGTQITHNNWGISGCAAGTLSPGTRFQTAVFTIPANTCMYISKVGGATFHTSAVANVYAQPAGPLLLPVDSYPPTYTISAPTGQGSLSTTLPAPPTGLGTCALQPLAANYMQRLLTPQTRVADGGLHAITGAGALAIAPSSVGWTIDLTAYPAEYSQDAGDPPQLYQVGWMAPSIDGVELSGPPQAIRAASYQFWELRPTDHYIVYFLYPGFGGDVQYWSTATPT
jgi:hypothetical protein